MKTLFVIVNNKIAVYENYYFNIDYVSCTNKLAEHSVDKKD